MFNNCKYYTTIYYKRTFFAINSKGFLRVFSPDTLNISVIAY